MKLIPAKWIFVIWMLASFTVGLHASENNVPVTVEFRQGMLDHHTYIARIQNDSDKTLSVQVLMERDKGVSKTFSLEIEPHQTKEIGLHQGWKAFSGDRVTVSSRGYNSFSEEIP